MTKNHKIQKYIAKYFNPNNNFNFNDELTNTKEEAKSVYSSKIAQYGGYDHNSIDDVLKFVSKNIKMVELTNNTDHRYCLISFGPPASGKSTSIELGIKKINEERNSNLTLKNFLHLNIDEYVEKSLMWETKKRKLSTENEETNEDAKYNSNLYNDIRYNIDQIFELFLHCCILFKLNFTMESTGANFYWNMSKIIELKNEFKKSNNTNLKNFGYNMVLMYPYTPNLNILINRAESRAIKSGRIITKDEFEKAQFIEKAKESFDKIVLPNCKHFFIICKYNAEINNDVTELSNDDIYVYFINKDSR